MHQQLFSSREGPDDLTRGIRVRRGRALARARDKV